MTTELTRDEAAGRVGVHPNTWSAYVSRGQAPPPTRHIGRTPLWAVEEVDQWVKSRPRKRGPKTRDIPADPNGCDHARQGRETAGFSGPAAS